ncbi:MAG: NifU family protein [Candidatus Poseidoniaceae archaeon]|jgi:Fe-S cluster biogenesis protein NfuA|nr:NifU family protein [Candidatus Poseidoniaceae archaeon]
MVEDKVLDDDDLVAQYRIESHESIAVEAERRIASTTPMQERIRLRALSLKDLVESDPSHPDLKAALLERLGPVRAALDEHGGGLEIANIGTTDEGLHMVLDLTGACLSCGSAPGTLAGLRSDLEADTEIISIRFSINLLDTFDELGREFVLAHGGVEFVNPNDIGGSV